MDLGTAIKMHIENERKWINPHNNPIINHNIKLHIKTIEQAPKNSKPLEDLIDRKRQEKNKASHADVADRIYIELQALERLYGIVYAYEHGEPLESLAY
jgi:hypothetical protein